MELRNRVKELRARYNLSQGELGKLADASRQTISLIERGDYSPSILLVLKIAKILKVSVEDIFYLEGAHENEDKKV
ncbi:MULTISPECIES: helix-turn-helix transcriptional regulator [Clostridium]|uniref:Helix-turn-helix transcriptional regulator n=1 Tax=Clostridium frigoriphilum TaxID=443253 RepID=A0ABU7URS3_9CLOT|nr:MULTISPECIES: helix-turn-helix transcriptional regulator [Clostridium]MBU3101068.1 helix-turn-helix transcriptional regulator [Clostridium sp. DSM 17811]MBW9152243.1 helix-turn-helix transcriptional regulator [Clostridium estertheticum]WLC82889.1 helix-turn-helix transcriptional regulator [Clostridium estertheticum]